MSSNSVLAALKKVDNGQTRRCKAEKYVSSVNKLCPEESISCQIYDCVISKEIMDDLIAQHFFSLKKDSKPFFITHL